MEANRTPWRREARLRWRLMAAVILTAIFGGSARVLAAPPRLLLEPPPGGPFVRGQLIRVNVDLEVPAEAFKYLAFGIRADPGSELTFTLAPPLRTLPGLEHYADRLVDAHQVSVGLGNFDFKDPRLVVPSAGGRLRVGAVNVQIGELGEGVREVALAVGECACLPQGALLSPVLDLGGPDGKLTIEGAELSLPLGDRDFLRADANFDGRIDIADAGRIIAEVFLVSFAGFCPDAADANDDGFLDVSDPIYLLGHLFLGGPAPPPPYPSAGPDPSFDGLVCGPAS